MDPALFGFVLVSFCKQLAGCLESMLGILWLFVSNSECCAHLRLLLDSLFCPLSQRLILLPTANFFQAIPPCLYFLEVLSNNFMKKKVGILFNLQTSSHYLLKFIFGCFMLFFPWRLGSAPSVLSNWLILVPLSNQPCRKWPLPPPPLCLCCMSFLTPNHNDWFHAL